LLIAAAASGQGQGFRGAVPPGSGWSCVSQPGWIRLTGSGCPDQAGCLRLAGPGWPAQSARLQPQDSKRRAPAGVALPARLWLRGTCLGSGTNNPAAACWQGPVTSNSWSLLARRGGATAHRPWIRRCRRPGPPLRSAVLLAPFQSLFRRW